MRKQFLFIALCVSAAVLLLAGCDMDKGGDEEVWSGGGNEEKPALDTRTAAAAQAVNSAETVEAW